MDPIEKKTNIQHSKISNYLILETALKTVYDVRVYIILCALESINRISRVN